MADDNRQFCYSDAVDFISIDLQKKKKPPGKIDFFLLQQIQRSYLFDKYTKVI